MPEYVIRDYQLREWHQTGIITHLCVRRGGRMVAACLVAPNDVRPSTAALFYVFAPDEHTLKPMLTKAVDACIAYGTRDLIADLINEHRQYEPVYRQLGFEKAAEWARCDLSLNTSSRAR